MSDYDNVIDLMGHQAASRAVGTAMDDDHDPEKARRAFELSKATGVSPNAIYGDVEGFERQQKGQMIGDLVTNNPHLQEYIGADPMNARLSVDDLGNLDEASQAMDKVQGKGIMATFAENFLKGRTGSIGIASDLIANSDRIGSAALAAYDFAGQQEEFTKLWNEPWARKFLASQNPITGIAAATAVAGFDSFMRLFNAAMVAGSEAVGAVYEANTGDASGGRKLIRDTYALAQIGTAGPGIFGGHAHPAAFQLKGVADPLRASAPYLEAGKEPPVGLHPEIDKLKFEQSQIELKSLDDVTRAAQKSGTREAHPETYAEFARMKVGDAKIGISIDAIDRIYGDKLPLPDDGKLGWATRLGEQIEQARQTGGDVEVPLAEWLAHVDPEVAKELHDDIRVRRGGVTVNEATAAKEGRVEGEEAVAPRPASPVESVRQAAALEPLFGIGDRKLDLKKSKTWPDEGFGAGHTFEMMSEKGEPVGYVLVGEHNGGKTLYIDNITGTKGLGPQDFGPSLIRDIIRQLKEQFPNAEELAGFRISGAREKAGAVKTKGEASIKLGIEDPKAFEQFRQILSERWEQVAPDFEVLPAAEQLSRIDTEVSKAIGEVLDRIAPQKRDVQVVESIRRTEDTDHKIAGLYQPYKSSWPLIAVALDSADPIGYARHEAIHHLRQYGFFTDKEWATLERAARDGKWVDEYDIGRKYKGQPFNVMFEESIAEAYRKWADGKDTPTQLHPIFEKMKQLYDMIKEKVKELFGREPTWEEIFAKIEKGEVGSREGAAPRGKEVFRGSEARGEQLEMPEATRMEDREAFNRAPPGMSIKRYEAYMKAIEERQKIDYEKDLAKAEKEQKKRQSAEWKAESNAMRPEVTKEVLDRPDVAADRFMRDGILYGEQVDKIKIGAEYLTPEQIEAMPKAYVAKKGAHPDDIAGLFGYTNGDAMVNRLIQYDSEWRQSGVKRDDFVRQMISQEINRRMELKHGKLEENILAEAKEQALSQNQLSILHEQTYHFAQEAGLQYPLDKAQLESMARKHFDALPQEMISSDRFLAEAGRAGRAAESAHLSKNPQEAFKQAQRQEYAAYYAKMALAFEEEQAKFDKLAKRYGGRELPNFADSEFRNYDLHAIKLLEEAGYPVRIRGQETLRELGTGKFNTLEKLTDNSQRFGGALKEVIDPDIIDTGVKPKEEMSVQEWRDFRDAVTAIDHEARELKKVAVGEKAMDRQEFREALRENFEKRPLIDPKTRNAMAKLWWQIDSWLVTAENLMKDFDYRAELGPFWSAIIKSQEDGKATAYRLETAMRKSFTELKGSTPEWRKSLDKEIQNTLIMDPESPNTPLTITRENMLRMMLNQGTEQARFKLAQGVAMAREGLKVTKEQVEATAQLIDKMIDQNATQQDWKFVKHIWDQHKALRPEIEALQRRTSGVLPKWVEGRKIQTKFGEIDGDYYPLSPDRQYQLRGKEIGFDQGPESTDGPFKRDYRRATPDKSHLKERTGRAYFVDITSPIDGVAYELKQVINDLAYREFGINAGKVLYDPAVRNMINRRYGPEYGDRMVPWLERALNVENNTGNELGPFTKAMRWARINLVHSALGNNIATIMSPSIGTVDPRSYGAYMANRADAKALVETHSKELANIESLMDRDVNRAVQKYIKRSLKDDVYDQAVKASFWAMKKTQIGLARVTFYEKFMEGKAEGLTDESAAALADARVRERHGSTGRADMSMIVGHNNEFVKAATVFMGYFGTVYNWRRTMGHNFREMNNPNATPEARLKSKQEFMAAAAGAVLVPLLTTAVFYTKPKQDENPLKFMWRVGFSEAMGAYPLARELTYFTESGRFGTSPAMSMIDSVYKMAKDGMDISSGKVAKKPLQHTMEAMGAAGFLPGGAALGRPIGGIHNVSRGTEPPPRDLMEFYRLLRYGETRLKK